MGERKNHNPAWTAYNETLRSIEVEYDKKIQPLRYELRNDLEETEERFNNKIAPLIAQKNKALADIKSEYGVKIKAAWKKRNDDFNKAREVLQEELKAKEAVPA